MFSGVIEVGHWLKLVKGCARYIFGSLFLSAIFVLEKIKFWNFRYSSFMMSSNARA